MKVKISLRHVLIALGAILAVALCVLLINVGVKNHTVTLDENANNAIANVHAQEKRRLDLVANLVATVKSYADFEHDTQMDVIAQRTKDGQIDAVGGAEINIKAVAEKYPELKASDNYKQLMLELATTENHIFDYRKIYNDAVRDYFSFIRKWPANSIIKEVANFTYLEYETPLEAPTNLFGE